MSYPNTGGIIDPAPASLPEIEYPSSSFFGILLDPTAYRSLAYLLILFPISIGLFVYSITMTSLALGLAITIFGLPLAYVFLISLPWLNQINAGLAEVILEVPMPRMNFKIPQGGFIERLVGLTKDRNVLSALVISILLFPLATITFVLMITSMSVSLSLFVVFLYPAVRSILVASGVAVDDEFIRVGFLSQVPEGVIIAVISILGFLFLIASLHLNRFLAYTYAKLVSYSLR